MHHILTVVLSFYIAVQFIRKIKVRTEIKILFLTTITLRIIGADLDFPFQFECSDAKDVIFCYTNLILIIEWENKGDPL